MKLLSYLAFLACLEGLCFAALVYWLRPRALLNRLGMAVGLLNAWWHLCLTVVYGAPDLETALVFDRLSYVAILGLNPVLAWFYLCLAGASRRTIAALVVPLSAVAVTVAAAYVTQGFPHGSFEPGPWGNVGVEAPHRLWSTVSDVAAIVLDAVFFGFLVRRRQASPSWRLKRLLTLILVGIVFAIGAYVVLGQVSDTLGLPSLTFLPAAVLMALHFYIITQFRFLQDETPRWDKHWADVLAQPVFLLDKHARTVGTNRRARSIGTSLLEAFPPEWSDRPRPTEVVTPLGRVRLSPHFDQFGDFVGAVALLDDETEKGLSPRETEVLALVAEGAGNQTIADKLFLSPGTVKRHVHAILAKTGAKSRRELVLRFGKAQA